ncbi:MAG: polysaccharide deacetylase [Oscillospiraceae bacterium]|nr:polysaccharide deacetylase [Oscillospiraceae bacterium]
MEEKQTTRRGRRIALAVTLITLAELLLLSIVLLGLDARRVHFYMTDGEEITVPWGVPYAEPGVRAFAAGRVTGEGEEELPVRVEGAVDTGTMGDYVLRYYASTMLRRYSVRRLVHVADTTAPVITLLRNEDYTPNWFEGYREEGFLALDDVDADLSDRVRVEMVDGDRVYTVTDAAGNTARVVRQIPYSIGRPQIRLNGGEELTIDAAFTFTDPGFVCTDERGNDLSAQVIREGEVIPWSVGDYELHYRVFNALGEHVEATRRVTVRPLRNPDLPGPEGKVIYLTFDDGPGPFTDGLLDVLAQYNVKATFFVTGLYPEYADCIGRAYREGHSIGVHSVTHSYRRIYASEEAFLEDFNAMQDIIRGQTGAETRIFRFPGGSSNTVSRFNRGVMTRLSRTMTELGYVYFDWNVDSDDAGDTTETGQVLQNIIAGCSEHPVSVVLQHDIKDYSVAAVERVLIWGISNGYSFAPLDETGPEIHHKIAN